MTNIVLFISEQNLVDRSDILTSTWSKPIANSIWQMQQSKVLPHIGTKAYQKLEELIVNGTLALPANARYEEMIRLYIQPALVSFVTGDLLPRINYKIASQGVVTQKNETGEVVDLKTVIYLQKRYESEGEWFMTQMSRFMLEFQNEIPEFSSNSYDDYRTILPKFSPTWSQKIYFRNRPSYPFDYFDGNEGEKRIF